MENFKSNFIKEHVDVADLTKLALEESKKNRISRLVIDNAEGLVYLGAAGAAIGLFQEQSLESVIEGVKQAYLASIPFITAANVQKFPKYNDPIHTAMTIDANIHATEKPGAYLLMASGVGCGIIALSAWAAQLYNSPASAGFGAKLGILYGVAQTIEFIIAGENYKKQLK